MIIDEDDWFSDDDEWFDGKTPEEKNALREIRQIYERYDRVFVPDRYRLLDRCRSFLCVNVDPCRGVGNQRYLHVKVSMMNHHHRYL